MTPDPMTPAPAGLVLPDAPDAVEPLCSRRAVLICGAGIVGTALLSACTVSERANQPGQQARAGLASGSPASGPGSAPASADSAITASAPAAAASSSGGPPTASASHAQAAQPTATHPQSASPHADPTPTHATPSSSPDPTPTHGATPTTAAPTPPPTISGTVLASVNAVPTGGSLVVQGPRGPVALFRSGDQVVAHTAICTHMGCTVGAAGKTLQCPCHGSQYDAATGQVLQGPAPDPLAAITVRVEGGQVVEP